MNINRLFETLEKKVVLARLRLGHTRVTHSYLLRVEEQPQCVACDAPFIACHFIFECGDFAQVRNNCFHVDNMKELFQDIHIKSIMTFFFKKIFLTKSNRYFFKSCFVMSPTLVGKVKGAYCFRLVRVCVRYKIY